jgi:hypothetical protein
MPFVQRDNSGEIMGVYENAQPGLAEEFLDDASPELKPKTNALVANQLQLINRASESAISAITATYPASEVLTWPKQEQEARAFLAGTAATPLIDALAEARYVEKEYLVEKIIEKSDQFAAVSGALIGKRQKLEDQLLALPPNASAEMISAIKWD